MDRRRRVRTFFDRKMRDFSTPGGSRITERLFHSQPAVHNFQQRLEHPGALVACSLQSLIDVRRDLVHLPDRTGRRRPYSVSGPFASTVDATAARNRPPTPQCSAICRSLSPGASGCDRAARTACGISALHSRGASEGASFTDSDRRLPARCRSPRQLSSAAGAV